MTWGKLVNEVYLFCKARWEPRGLYARPMDVARALNVTRLEAELALQVLVAWKHVGRRDLDGRYYFIPEHAGGAK